MSSGDGDAAPQNMPRCAAQINPKKSRCKKIVYAANPPHSVPLAPSFVQRTRRSVIKFHKKRRARNPPIWRRGRYPGDGERLGRPAC
jgi:hypothetical protein